MAGRINTIASAVYDRTRAGAITELDDGRMAALAEVLIEAQRGGYDGPIAVHRNGCAIVVKRLTCEMGNCTCMPMSMRYGARA